MPFIIFDTIGLLHCYFRKIIKLTQDYDLLYKVSTIVIEEARTLFSFFYVFKCEEN